MRLTDRDVEIIRWLNSHGFVTASQVSKYFDVQQSIAYRRLSKMVQEGYLRHERIFREGEGVYYATKDGVSVAGDKYPPIKKVNVATYEHQKRLVDLAIRFKDSGRWVTERHLRIDAVRADRAEGGTGLLGLNLHFPDAYLFQNGRRFAFELELTVKSKTKLLKIMDGYMSDFETEKIYYCVGSEAVENAVLAAAQQKFVENIEIRRAGVDF